MLMRGISTWLRVVMLSKRSKSAINTNGVDYYYNAGSMERWLKLTIISGMVSFPQTVATQIEDDHHAHHYCSSNLSVASLQSGAPRCRIVGRRLGRLRRPVSVRLSPQGPSTLGPSLSPRLGERPSTQVDR